MFSNEFINYCHECLYLEEAKEFKSYIYDRLTEESIKKWKIGYLPSPISIIENNSSFEEEGFKNNLFYKRWTQQIPSREIISSTLENHQLLIPYYNLYGDPIGLVGRTLLDYENLKISKYKNTSFDKSKNLWGLHLAKQRIIEKDAVLLLEGQIDVMSCFEKNIENAVAVGNSSLSGYQLSILLRYTRNIFLGFDNDLAGQKAISTIISQFGKQANFWKIKYPNNIKDIDQFLKSHSKDDFIQLLKQSNSK